MLLGRRVRASKARGCSLGRRPVCRVWRLLWGPRGRPLAVLHPLQKGPLWAGLRDPPRGHGCRRDKDPQKESEVALAALAPGRATSTSPGPLTPDLDLQALPCLSPQPPLTRDRSVRGGPEKRWKWAAALQAGTWLRRPVPGPGHSCPEEMPTPREARPLAATQRAPLCHGPPQGAPPHPIHPTSWTGPRA